jgi:hypothetical protein
VLPLSIYSTISVPDGHPVAAYVFFLVIPPLFFHLHFHQQHVSEGSSKRQM